MTANFVQSGDTFSGSLLIGGSPCFGGGGGAGTIRGSSVNFGAAAGRIAFLGSIRGSTVSGQYKVSNNAGGSAAPCAGDSGSFSLSR